MTTDKLTFAVRTLKHVPLAEVLAPLSEELLDLVVEELQNGETAWGNNAETFVTAKTLLGALENAISTDEYRLEYYPVPDADDEQAKYAAVADALKALPPDVLISLGG